MTMEQVAKLKLENAALSVALGYRPQDEGCHYAIDKDKAARPTSIIPGAGVQAAGTASPNAAAVVAEPGANRSIEALLGDAVPVAANGNGKRDD